MYRLVYDAQCAVYIERGYVTPSKDSKKSIEVEVSFDMSYHLSKRSVSSKSTRFDYTNATDENISICL